MKGYRGAGRAAVNEQVVGRLAPLLGAPVPPVRLIDLPRRLIGAHPELQRFEPGIAHGSRYIPDCIDVCGNGCPQIDPGRRAALAVLYSWVGAPEDRQLLIRADPRRIYSVDHGHVFPGAERVFHWTVESLQASPTAQLDRWPATGVVERHFQAALARLSRVTPQVIAAAVAAPPAEWNVSIAERVALARYLLRRREELLGATRPESYRGNR